MLNLHIVLFSENQLSHHDSKGGNASRQASRLIFPAPFRGGLDRKNQSADYF